VRVSVLLGSEATGVAAAPGDVADQAGRVEAQGFASAWCPHFSRGIDAMTTLAAAAVSTSTIELGVGVVPTYPRHPVALAQAAATVQSLSGGRLVLGVGVSHRPVIETMHGLDYSDQLGHMREYLTVLDDLLGSGQSSFQGSHFRVDAGITVPGTSTVPVVVGALGPKMARLAGELSAGVTTWLAGPRALGDVVVPAVEAGARDAQRVAPRVVAAVPVAIDDDIDRAQAAAGRTFARYGQLPNYQRLFAREGITGPQQVAVVGSADRVHAGLTRLVEAGATDVWTIPFDTGTGLEATWEVLASLASSPG
jgi:F420-dependent oxidoreductase-like protein